MRIGLILQLVAAFGQVLYALAAPEACGRHIEVTVFVWRFGTFGLAQSAAVGRLHLSRLFMHYLGAAAVAVQQTGQQEKYG